MDGFRYRKFGRDKSAVWNVDDDELIRNRVPHTITDVQAEGNSQPDGDIILRDTSGISAAAATSTATLRHPHLRTEETDRGL